MPEDRLILTKEYWDCECRFDFIRSKAEAFCPHCEARAEYQPNSRYNEVRIILGVTPDSYYDAGGDV